MFEASLLAFWTLAKGCDFTETEQAGLLAVSEHNIQRWRRETPPVEVNVLDRLQLVVQIGRPGSVVALEFAPAR